MVKKAAKQTKKIAAKSAVKKLVKKQPRAAVIDRVSLTHRLDALLHTMRCIAQHEDELCTLLHDARSGKAGLKLLRELHTILAELPAEEYTYDLDAVREMIAAA